MPNYLSILLNSICFYLINATTIVFLHCFYDTGFLWHKKKALLFLLAAVVQIVLDIAFPGFSFWSSMIFSIPYGIFATYDYKGKKTSAILRFILYTLFLQLMVGNYGTLAQFATSQKMYDAYASLWSLEVSPLTENFNTLAQESNVLNLCGILFFAPIYFYLYSAYRKGVVIRCGKREIALILTVSFLSLNLVTFVMIFAVTNNVRLLCGVTALLGYLWGFLFPVFIYYTRISTYYQKRTAIQEEHIQAELVHFQQYRQIQEETARFRHDIRNNLRCIQDMLQQDKSAEALEYLTDLLNVAKNLSAKYVTGDALLDSIVGVKAQIMESHGTRFELDGVLVGGLPWKPMDICNVFANALDNAFEACQKVAPEKRSVGMKIRSTPQFWFVTIENPVEKAVDTSKLFQKNGGYTQKSNSAQHGIGTYNMKYTVESYGAMIKAECTEEIFKLEIMIDKSSPE